LKPFTASDRFTISTERPGKAAADPVANFGVVQTRVTRAAGLTLSGHAMAP
jgi:hypothetical protein